MEGVYPRRRRRHRKIKRKKYRRRMRQDFPVGSGLQSRATIYVPSTIRGTKYVGKKRFGTRMRKVEKDMSNKFGGATLSRGEGTYTFQHKKGGRKRLAVEKVGMLTIFSTPDKFKRNRRYLRKYLKGKRKEWGQESIGLEYENPKRPHALYFIGKRKRKK